MGISPSRAIDGAQHDYRAHDCSDRDDPAFGCQITRERKRSQKVSLPNARHH